MEDTKKPITVAEEPFNNKETSDVVLQTMDNVQFYVNKLILSLSSSVFAGMFDLPSLQEQSSEDVVDGKPVIHLQDDSQDLFHLLSWCDPRGIPSVDNLQHMSQTIKLAIKYDMEYIMKRVESILISRPNLIKSDFSAIYAIGVQCGFPDLTKLSARHSLSIRMDKIPHLKELDFITGADVQKLYRYWYTCAEAVQATLHSGKWCFDEEDVCPWPELRPFTGTCRNCSDSRELMMRAWFVEYISRLKTLLYETPTPETINNMELSSYVMTKMISCSYCRDLFEQGKFGTFTESLKRKVQEAIEAVDIQKC